MAEEKEAGELLHEFFRRKKKPLVIGLLLALGLILAGAFLLHRNLSPSITKKTATEIGVVDLQKVMQVHPSYGKLQKLQKERQTLLADLAVLRPMPDMQPPQLAGAPFAALTEQKDELGRRQAAAARQKKIEAVFQARRAALQPQYEAEKKKIESAYENKILNLRIQLDNADSLRLSKETINCLQAQLDELRRSRGWQEQQMALAYDARVHHEVQQVLQQPEFSTAAAGTAAPAAADGQAALQAQAAATMEKANLTKAQQLQQVAEKRQELQEKNKEIADLEDQILKEIASLGTKLAIEHHLTLIVANPSVNLGALDIGMLHVGPWPEKFSPVIGTDWLDLTDELIKEIKQQSA